MPPTPGSSRELFPGPFPAGRLALILPHGGGTQKHSPPFPRGRKDTGTGIQLRRPSAMPRPLCDPETGANIPVPPTGPCRSEINTHTPQLTFSTRGSASNSIRSAGVSTFEREGHQRGKARPLSQWEPRLRPLSLRTFGGAGPKGKDDERRARSANGRPQRRLRASERSEGKGGNGERRRPLAFSTNRSFLRQGGGQYR